MDSPPLDNQTEFEAHPQLILTKNGERLIVVVKATFEIIPGETKLELAPVDRARAIRHVDEPWGEPDIESIRYPADVCPEKPGTDVIFVGTAHAPGGQPIPYFDAYLRVGSVSKSVRIFGLRVWESRGAGLSSPRPVSSLDLRYDYAWGGRDDSDPERVKEEARNPVGRGIRSNSSDLTHQLGPQIEDPDRLIKNASTGPPPAGLGAIGRSYSPRRGQSGTLDEAWKEFRCPLPPLDLQEEVYQAASPGLIALPPLRGGEECALLNLSSSGALQFSLPNISLEIEFQNIHRAAEVVIPPIDTVLIDTGETSADKVLAVELVWRATTKAPRKMKDSLITIREGRPQ